MSFPFEFHLTDEQREREGVERRELSALFAAFAQIEARRRLPRRWDAYGPLLEPPPRGWRNRAVHFLRALGRDGRTCVGTDLLRALLGRRVGLDPIDPVELMVTAVRIWPSPEGYLGLGQMLMLAGRVEEGREVYAFLLRTMNVVEDECFGWRVREGLGVAWQASGNRRLALGCLEASARRPGAGIGPLVAAWPLAVEVGQGAERSAGALDDRAVVGSRRLERCVTGVLARRRLWGAGEWLPGERSAAGVRQVLERGGATARLCRALLGTSVS